MVVSTSDGTTDGQITTFTILRPIQVMCKVPKLRGDSLSKARRALKGAHCALGKVSRPKHPGHKTLVIVSQSPKAGANEPAGSKVSVSLGQRRKRH